jgi:hypothetical protein
VDTILIVKIFFDGKFPPNQCQLNIRIAVKSHILFGCEGVAFSLVQTSFDAFISFLKVS